MVSTPAPAAAAPRAGRPPLDLTDRRFGKLVARERLPKLPGLQGERWLCLCDCERRTAVRVKDLTSGNTRSCGCLTNRPRAEADRPHRAGSAELRAAVAAAVRAALEAGGTLRSAAVRRAFDGRASRSSLYRFMHEAEAAWRRERAAAPASTAA